MEEAVSSLASLTLEASSSPWDHNSPSELPCALDPSHSQFKLPLTLTHLY